MALSNAQTSARGGSIQLGFKPSIIGLFVGIVLVIGLTLVYLSFDRISAVTQSAASQFIGKVAELSADRIGSQLKLVRDNLEILNALPPIQSAEIENNPPLYALLAAMVKNNEALFSLYVGYDDGSFIEMDDIGGTGRDARARLEAPEHAAFRLVVISRSDAAHVKSRRLFLSDKLETIKELPGPLDYDPRERPWYKDAARLDGSWLTGPYIFFATGKQGYTVQALLKQGNGVVAGDMLMDATQEALKREKLTASGVAFLFDDDDRILAHPRMSELIGREVSGTIPHLRETDMAGVLKAIRTWRAGGMSEQVFAIPRDVCMPRRSSLSPMRPGQYARRRGGAGRRILRQHPVERGRLFASRSDSSRSWCRSCSHGFAAVAIAAGAGRETDRIQRFEPSAGPPVRSIIREIDDLGHSVATMRSVTQTFSRFVPRRLVERLIETGTPLQLGGTRREVTLLFSDVVNFTEITEKADPTRVMQYTSRYFAAMSHEIMSHSGTVDKFIGDAIMAIWNAPADDPDHAANACAAALAFQRANCRLNVEFEREGWPVYQTRCGLHTGAGRHTGRGSHELYGARRNREPGGAARRVEQELRDVDSRQFGPQAACGLKIPLPQRRSHQSEGLYRGLRDLRIDRRARRRGGRGFLPRMGDRVRRASKRTVSNCGRTARSIPGKIPRGWRRPLSPTII